MVEWGDLAQADAVAELGPGTGSFTSAILDTIDTKTLFLAFEVNAAFAARLQDRFPAVLVYPDSAERLREYLEQHDKTQVDAVLCGLPWASLPMEVQTSVMQAIVDALRPGGTFATFAYIHALCLPNARRFRKRLESVFSSVERSPVVWRNLPPAFVYRCRK